MEFLKSTITAGTDKLVTELVPGILHDGGQGHLLTATLLGVRQAGDFGGFLPLHPLCRWHFRDSSRVGAYDTILLCMKAKSIDSIQISFKYLCYQQPLLP